MVKKIIPLTVSFVLFFTIAGVAFATMDAKAIKEHLTKVVGDKSSWAVTSLADLKKNMSYADVRAIFPQLPEMDIASKKIYKAKVNVEKDAIVDYYELKFREGKLYGAIINFRKDLDKKTFKQVSLEVFESKFGKVKADKRDKDIINKFSSEGLGAQRSWLVDHWLFEVDIP